MWFQILFVTTLSVLLTIPESFAGNFEFPDFDDTTGLVWKEAAATSTCESHDDADRDFAYAYQERHGEADVNSAVPNATMRESLSHMESFSQKTTSADEMADGSMTDAVVGHRTNVVVNETWEDLGKCATRARLTPSEPFKLGALWFSHPMEILSGFETGFSFQITDQAGSYTTVRDNSFGTKKYQSRRVHGGDGFAFVIQRNVEGVDATGKGGSGLGYAGLTNSIAIEFDTWYNPSLGDLVTDHVTVQAAGSSDECMSSIESSLHAPVAVDIADGRIHHVRIRYFNNIRYDLSGSFSLLPRATQFIKRNGDGTNIGTLTLWVDDMEEPIIAIPFNIASALELDDASAFVGFTASTGSSWEKHDILSWYFCEEVGVACDPLRTH